MSFKFGVYDFFGYFLVGFCWAAAGLLVWHLSIAPIDFASLATTVSFSSVSVMVLAIYLAGLVFEPIGKLWQDLVWRLPVIPRLLGCASSDDIRECAFSAAYAKHRELFGDPPSGASRFPDAATWQLLYLRAKKSELGAHDGADGFKTKSMLLRNVSISALMTCLIVLGCALWPSKAQLPPNLLILSGLLLSVAFLAGWQSLKYETWFYARALETVLSASISERQVLSALGLTVPTDGAEMKEEPGKGA